MTGWLRGYDEWLMRGLDECAREAGEDVDTYVARAVATRMLADLTRSVTRSPEEMVSHLAEAGVFTDPSTPDVSAAIADPGRLRALHATGLLDSPVEEVYDRITRAAAQALDAPHALVSLVAADRQFFKSAAGLGELTEPERQTPLDRSVCQYAVANGAPLLIEDARTDPLFQNHPAVVDGTVVAYLGIPLTDGDGNAIGTLCVFDEQPRLWTTGHVQILTDLAELATERIFGTRPAG
ncbi:MAG: GAF domain-containing protein [Actinomycetota bacterium]|nr:GAF domain-containing protein [Actinomycetota bacterium]